MKRLSVAVLVSVLMTVGCGDSAPTPVAPSPPGFANLTVAIPPADATRSSQTAFPWAANFTVNLIENAGISIEVHDITVRLGDGVVYDMTDIQLAAGSTTVPGRNLLAVPLAIAFDTAGLNTIVVVRGTDEAGHAIESEGRLVVIPAQRP